MLGRQGDAGLGPLLGPWSLPSVQMQPGSPGQDSGKGCGARQLSGQDERLLVALHGLLWIAQQPQDRGRKLVSADPPSDRGRVPLGGVQGYRLLQVRVGCRQLTKPEQALAHLPVTDHKERRVTLALGHAEDLLCQLLRRLVLALLYIEFMKSRQRHKELRGLPHLLAQLPRPYIDLSRFWRPTPLRGPNRFAERDLQGQFSLRALDGVRQRLEQL